MPLAINYYRLAVASSHSVFVYVCSYVQLWVLFLHRTHSKPIISTTLIASSRSTHGTFFFPPICDANGFFVCGWPSSSAFDVWPKCNFSLRPLAHFHLLQLAFDRFGQHVDRMKEWSERCKMTINGDEVVLVPSSMSLDHWIFFESTNRNLAKNNSYWNLNRNSRWPHLCNSSTRENRNKEEMKIPETTLVSMTRGANATFGELCVTCGLLKRSVLRGLWKLFIGLIAEVLLNLMTCEFVLMGIYCI